MARGEGGYASKEYFSGVYKTAGAATYAAVVGADLRVFLTRRDYTISRLQLRRVESLRRPSIPTFARVYADARMARSKLRRRNRKATGRQA